MMDTNKLNLLKTYIGAKAKENDSMAQFDLAQFFLSKEGFAEYNSDSIDDTNTTNSENKQSIIIQTKCMVIVMTHDKYVATFMVFNMDTPMQTLTILASFNEIQRTDSQYKLFFKITVA